jgi:ketosteroid isomerase-like protein
MKDTVRLGAMSRLAILFAMVLATNALFAACPTDAKTKEAVIAVEQRWAHALEVKDAAAIDCILGPEFVDTGVNGELHNRSQALTGIKDRKPWKNMLEDLQVTFEENTAIVHGVNRVTDQSGNELARVRFTDVFFYREKRWKAISGHETLVNPLK